jgi:predicted acylesterase/phospholipase RssA
MAVRALCLSAGGMFGAYQAGVWAEINQIWKPDLIVGASIGALNGWMIACDCPVTELLDHWRSLDPLARHRYRLPLPPWRGAVEAAHIERMVQDICGNRRPSKPIGIVATQWAGMKLRLYRDEEITWRHLMAACAVPLALPQQRINGRWHTDGGLLSASPVSSAVRMGATEILSVNVLPKMPWFVRWPVRAASLASGHRKSSPGHVRVVSLRPDPVLGTWREACVWDRARTEHYIQRGRQDARRAVDRLRTDSLQQSAHAAP